MALCSVEGSLYPQSFYTFEVHRIGGVCMADIASSPESAEPAQQAADPSPDPTESSNSVAEEAPEELEQEPEREALETEQEGRASARDVPLRSRRGGAGDLERWIDQDLAEGGWDRTGITPEMLKLGQATGMRTFRVCILGRSRRCARWVDVQVALATVSTGCM